MKTDVIKETWNRSDILDFCTMMGWHELMAGIEALDITSKMSFTDRIKYGDIQITLYRKAILPAHSEEDCPFYFTVDCK